MMKKNHQPSAITMRYIRELMNIWLARWAYFNEPMSASLTRAINYLNLYGYQSYKVISRFDYETAEGKKDEKRNPIISLRFACK